MKRDWEVEFHPAFDPEFDTLELTLLDELLAQVKFLEAYGPTLGRPRVGTLKGSRPANMKELRFAVAGGVWRIEFAFDPVRKAILLVAGDKTGVGERRFYQQLIKKADYRFDLHIVWLKANRRTKR